MAHDNARTISRIGRTPSTGERKGFAFEPVGFPVRQWADSDYGLRYHVYRSRDERVSVQADSAVDAIKESGIERPYMVVRGHASSDNRIGLIRKGRLVAEPEPVSPDEPEQEKSS